MTVLSFYEINFFTPIDLTKHYYNFQRKVTLLKHSILKIVLYSNTEQSLRHCHTNLN